MIENKEELINEISKILSKKSFTPKAKDNLMRSIVFAYEFYKPPKYIKANKSEYIMEYLKVLENMNGYAVIELSEMNEQNEPSTYFRSAIQKSTARRGNLDLVNGKYVPVQGGKYYCSCKGFTWNKERMMFTLNENNFIEELGTIHHEMTHLTEGTCPFPLPASIPFAFEVRKMLYEGRAATKESYIQTTTGILQGELLEDGTFTYQIDSEYSYPLYGKIYQMLQIIFQDEDLESFSKNNDSKKNFILELKEKYPLLPVEEIFAHIIYIVSCSSKEQRETLASSIHHYARFHAKEVEWTSKEIKLEQNCVETYQNTVEELKQKEQELSRLESDQFPMILERVCLKHPSLDTSFEYLERIALTVINEGKKTIQEADSEYPALLDKARVLSQLKERTVVIGAEKKTSLVS